MDLNLLYRKLFSTYGPQGWWPIQGLYHPADYSFPKNEAQQFEICIGAILTQNTAWANVEKALTNLQNLNAIHPKQFNTLDSEILLQAIKPAGYYNQKLKKLKIFLEFFQNNKDPSREHLLGLWGIGQETADSILLYAFRKPEFVIDAYTKRISSHLKICSINVDYHTLKNKFEQEVPKDLVRYQEFHALLVQHAKVYYQKKPYVDPILNP